MVSDRIAAAARWSGRKVLITGGLGFIGSNLAHRLDALGADITIIDSLNPSQGGTWYNIAGIDSRARIAHADLRDLAELDDWVRGSEIIFNLAGQSAHLDSMTDPFRDLHTNCTAQLRLLEACRKHCPQAKIIFASTRQVYGKPEQLPVNESHPVRPVDINGVHKLAAESYHAIYDSVYGLRAVTLRLTNTYGPRMRIKDARQTFLGVWIKTALEDGPLEIWDGWQLRDLSYVDDCVSAMLLAADSRDVDGRVFNLGGDRPVNLIELARLLIAANGSGSTQMREFPVERKAIDIGNYYADDSAFRRATGWAPRVTLEEGLRRTLAYFRDHQAHYV